MTARPRSQNGAALLLALLVLTLVATLAAGMVWQQARSVQIEAAERAATQAHWMLDGALDWARLILREDLRTGGADFEGEPWSTPLAEARLSSFLAADRDNTVDSGPDAFLSGLIVDAQARYNLRNLIDAEGKVAPIELRALQRLCDSAGVPSDTPQRIAEGLRQAREGGGDGEAPVDVPLEPRRVHQLVWLGLDAATVARLEPFVTLLPMPTPVNVNTASREVLMAAVDGLDLATAERLRQGRPYRNEAAIQTRLPQGLEAVPSRISFRSSYFEVQGRLRLEDRVIEERALVERRGADRGLSLVTVWRDRRSLMPSPR